MTDLDVARSEGEQAHAEVLKHAEADVNHAISRGIELDREKEAHRLAAKRILAILDLLNKG